MGFARKCLRPSVPLHRFRAVSQDLESPLRRRRRRRGSLIPRNRLRTFRRRQRVIHLEVVGKACRTYPGITTDGTIANLVVLLDCTGRQQQSAEPTSAHRYCLRERDRAVSNLADIWIAVLKCLGYRETTIV